MPFPRPRFTVRRLMLAVAVLGIVLGGSLELVRHQRRYVYAHSLHRCEEAEAEYRSLWKAALDQVAGRPPENAYQEGLRREILASGYDADDYRDAADKFARARDAYRQRIVNPWLPPPAYVMELRKVTVPDECSTAQVSAEPIPPVPPEHK